MRNSQKEQDHIKQILSYCLSICEANERHWYLSVMSKNFKNTFVDIHKKQQQFLPLN
jgi:hypothetical protein